MNIVHPLPGSQSDYGGTAACTAIACALSVHVLVDRQSLSQPLEALGLILDEVIKATAVEWSDRTLGFLDPADTLTAFPLIGDELYIHSELATDVAGPLCDAQGNVIVPSTRDSILAWMQGSHKASTSCIVVRGGYSFLLFYAAPYYFIVDTHANTILRHSSTFFSPADTDNTSSGLLLRTLLPQQIIQFIVDYAPLDTADRSHALTSSNQVDFVFLALKA